MGGMISTLSRRLVRGCLPVLGLAGYAACGLELDVSAVNEGTDGSLSSASSGAPGTSSGGPGSSGSPSSSSSSSSGTASSSGTSSPDGSVADASDDAPSPPEDAAPDAPPLVCTSRSVTAKYCVAENPVTCQSTRNSSNYPAVFVPSGAAIGQTYFNDPIQTAPFEFDVGTSYYSANGSGVVAVFLGGNPANQGDLCARLDALADGEAAVVFWRQGAGDFQLRILTDCGGSPWQPSTPGSKSDGYVHVAYDGTKLVATATAGGAAAAPKELAYVLAPSIRLGVVVEADDESFLLDHMTLTCP